MKRKPTMRVFIYEYMTATGIGREPGSPDHGIYLEGRAMRDALVDDLTRCGAEVGSFTAEDEPFFHRELEEVALRSRWDWVLVIAPESSLLSFTTPVVRAGRRLLCSAQDAIWLTSDKLELAEYWRARGVPTPATSDRYPTTCEMFPVVWKPRDGAGSSRVFRLDSSWDVPRAIAQRSSEGVPEYEEMILQEFVPGRAASVAFLCGPRGDVPLLPTFQLLSDDGRFKYRGGELPIPPDLAERAVKLARRAVECVPGLLGYVGVDLVLGAAEDGSRDYAIEINPRLTTSYVGLRALADFNIAEMMLKVATGEPTGELKWKPARVRFSSDGTVNTIGPS